MPNQRRFNRKDVDIIFSSFKMFGDIWDEERLGKKWISLADKSMDEMTEIIISTVKDQTTRKNIIVQNYQKFVGGSNHNKIKDHLLRIKAEVEAQRANKLSFSTAFFVPNHIAVWDKVGEFNQLVHQLCDEMGVTRVNLHRAVMAQMSPTDRSLRVRASSWAENQLCVGLGSNPSYEACQKIANTVITVFDKAFCEQNLANNPKSRPPTVKIPPCLSVTPGFCDVAFMRQLLVDKMIIKTKKKSSNDARPKHSEQRAQGWRDWHIYKLHGSLDRYTEKEGALLAHRMMLKKGDEVPVWEENPDEWVTDRNVVIINPMINNNKSAQANQEAKDAKDNDDKDDYDEHQINDVHLEAEPQKQNKTVYNEDEQLAVALNKVDMLERQLEICQEKVKAYEKTIDGKEALVHKEKAAAKYWRQQSEFNKTERSQAVDQNCKLRMEVNSVTKELERMTSEYEYLRNLYESQLPFPFRVKVTRHFQDTEDNSDPDGEVEEC